MAKCIEQVIKRGLKDSVDHLANVRTLAKAKNCDKPAHWRVLITKERATLIPYDGKGRPMCKTHAQLAVNSYNKAVIKRQIALRNSRR